MSGAGPLEWLCVSRSSGACNSLYSCKRSSVPIWSGTRQVFILMSIVVKSFQLCKTDKKIIVIFFIRRGKGQSSATLVSITQCIFMLKSTCVIIFNHSRVLQLPRSLKQLDSCVYLCFWLVPFLQTQRGWIQFDYKLNCLKLRRALSKQMDPLFGFLMKELNQWKAVTCQHMVRCHYLMFKSSNPIKSVKCWTFYRVIH